MNELLRSAFPLVKFKHFSSLSSFHSKPQYETNPYQPIPTRLPTIAPKAKYSLSIGKGERRRAPRPRRGGKATLMEDAVLFHWKIIEISNIEVLLIQHWYIIDHVY